jgi:hypothetical protein
VAWSLKYLKIGLEMRVELKHTILTSINKKDYDYGCKDNFVVFYIINQLL